jgi:hypothetical protein
MITKGSSFAIDEVPGFDCRSSLKTSGGSGCQAKPLRSLTRRNCAGVALISINGCVAALVDIGYEAAMLVRREPAASFERSGEIR